MDRTNLTPDRFPSIIDDVIEIARSTNTAAYLVGGSVRDALLGYRPKDLDVLVFGPAHSFAGKLAERLGGRSIYLGQQGKAVWRIVGADFELDIVPPRGPDLASDLRVRDFTVNALAWSPTDEQIVDPLGGLSDLGRRLIRMVRRESFAHDPIRLLRAFRLAASLGFDIEVETLGQIRTDHRLIDSSAPERIHSELLGLLEHSRATKQIRAMHECGLLERLLGPPWSHQLGYSLRHTFAAMEGLENLTGSIEATFPGNEAPVREYLEKPHRTALLKFSLLFHPSVPRIEPDCAGPSDSPIERRNPDAEFLQSVQKHFALSNFEARTLADLLGLQINVGQILGSYRSGELGQEHMLRLLRTMGTNAVGALLLALARLHAFGGAMPEGSGDFAVFRQLANVLLEMYATTFHRRMKEPPLVRGTDLMAEGVPRGPFYREILDEIEAARIEGRLQDREEALRWMRRLLADRSNEND